MGVLKHQVQPSTVPVTSDGLRRNQIALEAQIVAAGASGVTTFNTRSGAVVLVLEDVRQALGVTYATNALKVLRVNAGETGFELAPPTFPSYTVATLPTPAAGVVAFVTNGTRPNVPAYANGTSWRYFTDDVVVS